MIQKAKFEIGEIVKHRYFDFRGVIFDVDLLALNNFPRLRFAWWVEFLSPTNLAVLCTHNVLFFS